MKNKWIACLIIMFSAACSVPSGQITANPPDTITPTDVSASTPASTIAITPSPIPISTASPANIKVPKSAASNFQIQAKSAIENANRLVWLPGSQTLAAVTLNSLTLLNGHDLSIIKQYKVPDNTSLLDFDPISQYMALTEDRMSLKIMDWDGKTLQTFHPSGGFGSATFAPGGQTIWLSSMEEFKAVSYDVKTGKKSGECGGFETAAPVYAAFPSPSGKWLVWTARATIQLNHLPDCTFAAHIGHEDFIMSHTFSSDETILATSTGGTLNGEFQPLIFLYDAATGEKRSIIPLKDSPAMGLAFSPDGTLLASAGSGLFLWDASTGKQVAELAPTDQRFTSVAFSVDGTLLAASSETEVAVFKVK